MDDSGSIDRDELGGLLRSLDLLPVMSLIKSGLADDDALQPSGGGNDAEVTALREKLEETETELDSQTETMSTMEERLEQTEAELATLKSAAANEADAAGTEAESVSIWKARAGKFEKLVKVKEQELEELSQSNGSEAQSASTWKARAGTFEKLVKIKDQELAELSQSEKNAAILEKLVAARDAEVASLTDKIRQAKSDELGGAAAIGKEVGQWKANAATLEARVVAGDQQVAALSGTLRRTEQKLKHAQTAGGASSASTTRWVARVALRVSCSKAPMWPPDAVLLFCCAAADSKPFWTRPSLVCHLFAKNMLSRHVWYCTDQAL